MNDDKKYLWQIPLFSSDEEHSVTLDQYQQFLQRYKVWCALTDITLGQAFCDHFGIKDDLLRDLVDPEFIRWRIEDCWLKK